METIKYRDTPLEMAKVPEDLVHPKTLYSGNWTQTVPLQIHLVPHYYIHLQDKTRLHDIESTLQ